MTSNSAKQWECILREVPTKELIELLYERSVNDSKKVLRNAFSLDIYADENDPKQVDKLVEQWWDGVTTLRKKLK